MEKKGGKVNKVKYIAYLIPVIVLMFVPYFMGVSMQSSTEEISSQKTADMVYAVLQANRVAFDNSALGRVSPEERVIMASEHWMQDKTLPLPEQIFQVSSAELASSTADLSFSLQSLWAINQDNFPQSDKEREGLIYILKNPGKNYYTTVESNGRKFLMAVYPDNANSPACVECHNGHKDSPKQDFQVGDLMGGVVLRIPL
ncbi:c-type heme family protein [Kaarinaea lacus]